MATYRYIIESALRRISVLGAGQEAETHDFEQIVPIVTGIYRDLVGSGSLGLMRDVPIVDDYVASPGDHVIRKAQFAGRIILPTLVGSDAVYANHEGFYKGDDSTPLNEIPANSDGSLAGVTTPRDCSVIYITDEVSGKTARFIFDGMTKKWMNVDEALLDKEAPLSDRNVTGFIAWVCYLIAEDYGKTPSSTMMKQMTDFRRDLTARRQSYSIITPGIYI